jgi:hypothetical protein
VLNECRYATEIQQVKPLKRVQRRSARSAAGGAVRRSNGAPRADGAGCGAADHRLAHEWSQSVAMRRKVTTLRRVIRSRPDECRSAPPATA